MKKEITLSEKLAKLPKRMDGFTLMMGVTKLYGEDTFFCGYLMPRFVTQDSNGEDFCHYNCNEFTYYSEKSIENAVGYVYDLLIKKGIITDE